jgi:hypothetical protein
MLSSQRLLCSVLAAAALVTTSGIALADHIKNEGAGFKFEVPSNWARSQHGEVFVVAPKDKSVLVMLNGHPNQVMTEKAAAFDTGVAAGLVGKMLGEVKLTGKVEEIKHNGMPCLEWAGEGKKDDGKVVEFVSLTCKTGEKKGVSVVGFASAGGVSAHRPALRRIFGGLEPIKP